MVFIGANTRSSGNANPDLTGTAGGYIANSSALAAVAANGAGQYAVAGTSVGNTQYFVIYDSGTNNQICETAFLATQDGADPYDTGFATSVSPSATGDGSWYVAGSQHDMISTPVDFDATIVNFNSSCVNIDPPGATAPHQDVIVGDVGHDEFDGVVSTTTGGVVAVGEVQIPPSGPTQYAAGRFANDLQTHSFLSYYPVAGAAGPNQWNAIACDPAAHCAAGGFGKINGIPGLWATLNQLAPDGSIPGFIFPFSDSGDSQFTSVSRTGSVATGDLKWYAGGSIVDSSLMAPCNTRACAIVFSALSQDFSAGNCAVYFIDTLGSSGSAIDASAHIFLVNRLDPAGAPPRPQEIIELNQSNCTIVPPGVGFGGTTGAVNNCGAAAFDTFAGAAGPALAACTTTSDDWAPITDGSTNVVGTSLGVASGFAP